MDNPFPGIDPYVEAQKHWEDFHTRFLTYACDAINDRLPDRYDASLEERFTIATVRAQKESQPDLTILRDDAGPAATRRVSAPSGILTEPVIIPLPTLIVDEVTERWIEIRREDRSVVAAIELLSPSNKIGEGRSRYLDKRRLLTHEPVHLIELDFLLDGARLPMDEPLPTAHFYAFVSRAGRRPNSEVFAWSIHQPLPTIPIPLDPPDPDVELDLPALYALAHQRGRYSRKINCDRPLGLPLASEDLAWAASIAGGPGS
jgi:hypothetical protein